MLYSLDVAVSTRLHHTPSHLERKNTYTRLLFINFSSAINDITPQQLIEKLRLLDIDAGICTWVLSFLAQREQTDKVGCHRLDISVSTGDPQG